jgi:putative membrane protein
MAPARREPFTVAGFNIARLESVTSFRQWGAADYLNGQLADPLQPLKPMKTPFPVTRAIPVVAFALWLGSSLYAEPGTASNPSSAPAAPAAASTVSRGDRRFLEKAAQSGNADLEFAKLGSARATDSGLKAFAQKLVADHEAANTELATLATRKNVKLPSPDRETRTYDALTKKKVGTEFDSSFAKEMASDHDDEVSLYDKAAKKSDDPEIASYASKYLPLLADHKRTAESFQKTIKP